MPTETYEETKAGAIAHADNMRKAAANGDAAEEAKQRELALHYLRVAKFAKAHGR